MDTTTGLRHRVSPLVMPTSATAPRETTLERHVAPEVEARDVFNVSGDFNLTLFNEPIRERLVACCKELNAADGEVTGES
uniref:Uncharacterized protein n=1 Tax=Oryza punctata TaxID=4537 RepID=A0A0E0JF13_ORYPU